jgi:histidinol-phosphatase (PHP family)
VELYDQHLHSWNSFDSKTPPEENVACAIQNGLAGLTFTEHFDTNPAEWDRCVYDDAKIAAELESLRGRYGKQVFIGKGIEVCYQPARMDFILDFLAKHQFDVILLSVHWAQGRPVHEREHFEAMDARTFIINYMEAVRDATANLVQMKRQGRQPFQVLGHMDFAKRYAKRYFDFEGPVDTPELVDAILRNCLEAGIIPEVNTSTLRNKMREPMPGPATMKRYAELGGTMMSLGSDAHTPQYVGSHFDVALDMMQSAGLRQVAVFRQGKLVPQTMGSRA